MDRALILLTLCCAACATTATPVKVGESTWMLSGTDSWAVSNENAVIDRLTAQASAHCAERGESMEMIDTASSKPYGQPAQGRVTYECIEAGDGEGGAAAAEAADPE